MRNIFGMKATRTQCRAIANNRKKIVYRIPRFLRPEQTPSEQALKTDRRKSPPQKQTNRARRSLKDSKPKYETDKMPSAN